MTFLFTDVEGATRRWEADPGGMRAALADHDQTLRQAIESREGCLFKHTGDGVCAANYTYQQISQARAELERVRGTSS
ncbi:hypothetical protein A9W99_01940 [Mycobacterium sp. 1164966.3]|nr:hypothetical protein A9W99_01940 [Mycobacterium sp. 1164966.3]